MIGGNESEVAARTAWVGVCQSAACLLKRDFRAVIYGIKPLGLIMLGS